MNRVGLKVRELSPDVVLLQEVWMASHLERLVNALRSDWTPAYIKRGGGGPKGGLLTLVRESAGWRIRSAPEFHAFTASAPAWKIWEGDGLGGKGVLGVELEHGEQRICAINTHLQSQYSGSNYVEVREAQLIELRNVVAQFRPVLPALVAGDFNTDAHEPLYSRILALGADLTARARALDNRGTTANPRDGRPEWIDYVVAANSDGWEISTNLELIANQRADFPYSDHSGLFCTVTFAQC